MAKNKNRKKSGKKGSPTTPAPQDKENKGSQPPVTTIITQSPEQIRASQTHNERERPRNLVRLSTCVAGMFMAFIFGIYLGSFIPGLIKGIEKDKVTVTESKISPTPQLADGAPLEAPKAVKPETDPVSSPQPAPPSIPQEIREHLRHLQKEAEANPQDANVWTELGNTYFDIQDPEKAIEAYGRSLALSPDNPDVLTDMGIMYREIKNYDKALECFRKASQINPSHINALFNAGVVLSSDLGKREEAARVWQKVLSIRPDATTPDGHKISDMVRQLQ